MARSVDGERSDRTALRGRLLALAAFSYATSAPIESRDRPRWRNPIWREEAIETLLSIGAGRCLAVGCSTPLVDARGSRSYCSCHRARERDRGRREQRVHDAAIAGVANLLREVGELLNVD